jgi:hypothetical protein
VGFVFVGLLREPNRETTMRAGRPEMALAKETDAGKDFSSLARSGAFQRPDHLSRKAPLTRVPSLRDRVRRVLSEQNIAGIVFDHEDFNLRSAGSI